MSTDGHGFVEWKEQFVSQERGSRVVHYFLKDVAGNSVLAVVGTERSLRHMVYVVSSDFLLGFRSQNSTNTCFKWRSRREVVDWLTSMLVKKQPSADSSKSPTNDSTQATGFSDFATNRVDVTESHPPDRTGRFARKLKGHDSDIVWSGVAWTCGKQLMHYPAFCRNGITITIHSFVLVMAKEEDHYLAYLEDMYEDKKGHKKVRVRWFHHNQEVKSVVLLPRPHPREVFFTPYAQVISAECVDGPATILTPEHYEKCLATLAHISGARVYLCFRQFKNNKVKLFDISKLRGYFDQTILSCLDPSPLFKQNLTFHNPTTEEEEDFSQEGTVKQGAKRTRSCRGRHRFLMDHSNVRVSARGNTMAACGPAYDNLKFRLSGRRPLSVKCVRPHPLRTPHFKVDEKVEILCQDSGIRGCWFRCTVLQASHKQLKVQYDDVQNEDGSGNLEEWVPAFRLAAPDKLGMRCSGRLTVRPCPPLKESTDGSFEIGAPVDAWWSDGWWEGVVTGVDDGDGSLQVYFPGEDVFSTFQKENLRSSKDWFENQWVDIKAKPDILSAISAAVSPGTKLSGSTTIAKGADSGGSAMSDHELPTIKLETVEEDKQDLAGGFIGSDVPAEDVKWVTLRKRQRIEDEDRYGNSGDHDENDRDDDDDGDAHVYRR
uniref:BAH domain-containing protein n=1 Tax=Nelumbo nucifera TaxID=4432 RepID=A0A822XRY5_NELNU|nr:TPA_asm: hypothetical protein HUJ06_021711 [Nelumbo nucifera]